MKLGFLGLGKMGTRMVEKLLREGHEVVVWNRTYEVAQEFQLKNKKEKIKIAETIEELIKSLDMPRVIWVMLPAGEATEEALTEVARYLKKDSGQARMTDTSDIVIDGGNAFFRDTERHYNELRTKNIKFLGIGVSGGVIAEKTGYPLMVGGDVSAYQYITTILDSLARPQGGHEYFGTGGAGHFVKMVHNAIEYSYMQGIGEGFGVLQNSEYKFDLVKVAKLYQKNTLVSGFMMDRTADALEKDPQLEHIDGVIGKASGETIWTVDEAKKHDLFIENIEQALEFRGRSEKDEKIQKSFAARLVSALRREFGGHAVKEKV